MDGCNGSTEVPPDPAQDDKQTMEMENAKSTESEAAITAAPSLEAQLLEAAMDVDEDSKSTAVRITRRSTRAARQVSAAWDDDDEYRPAVVAQETEILPSSTRRLTRPSKRVKEEITAVEVEAWLSTPLTDQERRSWKGWATIESEPAFFNVILREWGVSGIKVQELFSLDEDMMKHVPHPIYGLIFLYEFVGEDDPDTIADSTYDHVWFSHQVDNDSCATVALLNIIMNNPTLAIGPYMTSFRTITAPHKPRDRGLAIGYSDHIRGAHNSFMRKMDMLNVDLRKLNTHSAKNAKKRKARGRGNKSRAASDENGFHFIAFVPIDGTVWQLDGLQDQPVNIGDFEGDWMDIARPAIQARMVSAEAEGQSQFTLLALCKTGGKNGGDDRSGLAVEASARSGDANGIESARDFMEEMRDAEQDDERARGRRVDYTPAIRRWVETLAMNGTLEGLVKNTDGL